MSDEEKTETPAEGEESKEEEKKDETTEDSKESKEESAEKSAEDSSSLKQFPSLKGLSHFTLSNRLNEDMTKAQDVVLYGDLDIQKHCLDKAKVQEAIKEVEETLGPICPDLILLKEKLEFKIRIRMKLKTIEEIQREEIERIHNKACFEISESIILKRANEIYSDSLRQEAIKHIKAVRTRHLQFDGWDANKEDCIQAVEKYIKWCFNITEEDLK